MYRSSLFFESRGPLHVRILNDRVFRDVPHGFVALLGLAMALWAPSAGQGAEPDPVSSPVSGLEALASAAVRDSFPASEAITVEATLRDDGGKVASEALTVGRGALQAFAEALRAGSRTIKASRHDRAAAHLDLGKRLAGYRPTVSVSEGKSNSANRTFNTLTGVDEDYSTQRTGNTVTVGSRTPLGTARFQLEQSETTYSKTTAQYFQAAYLSLETGLFQHDERIQRLERQVARGRYRVEQARADSVLLDTLSEGFGALLDRLVIEGNVRFRERNLDFYRKMVEEAQVKFESGLGSELDLKQAKMRLTLAETEVQETRLNLDEADRKLGLLLGTPDWDRSLASMSARVLAELVPEDLSEGEIASRAERLRPDLRMLFQERSNAEHSLRLAREQAKPDLAMNGSWGRQGRSNSSAMAREMRDRSWNVSLVYSTALGTRPERYEVQAQRQRFDALRLRLSQTEDAARKQIRQDCERIAFQRKNLTDLRDSLHLSAEILEGQRLNFQLGKISLLDLWRYQNDFESSSLAVIRAEAGLARSWLDLLYHAGELAETFGVADGV